MLRDFEGAVSGSFFGEALEHWLEEVEKVDPSFVLLSRFGDGDGDGDGEGDDALDVVDHAIDAVVSRTIWGIESNLLV